MKWEARILSFCVGAISLGVEILWVKLAGFAHHSLPQSFALVLALYLVGIALGAHLGKRYCSSPNIKAIISFTLTISALLDVTLPILFSEYQSVENSYFLLTIFIILTASTKSVLFPIAHHLGSDQEGDTQGRSVSVVYFFNIAGSSLGPLAVGFILLDLFSLQQCFALIAAFTFLLSAYFAFAEKHIVGIAALPALFLSVLSFHADERIFHRLIDGEHTAERVTNLIENRHGVIYTLAGGSLGDVVFGGNVYDGRVNTDLRINSNGIHRVYITACLVPSAKKILVIGLSSGSWVRILQEIPEAERIDVVEINPGYIELVKSYPAVASILNDKRTHIHSDDGRRWLNQHPADKFDLIVMNTTWHWRAYTSLLLSADFLTIAKAHLNPSGLIAYNSTGSQDVVKTAASVFPHAYRYGNFVYASDSDFRQRKADCPISLSRMTANGKPVFPKGDVKADAALQQLTKLPFVDMEIIQKAGDRTYEIITDQNMLTEYKYGWGIN